MKITNSKNDRRSFLKTYGLSTASILLPITGSKASPSLIKLSKTPVNFIYDGLALSPSDYLKKLTAINEKNPIEPDFYGHNGDTKLLEGKFAKLTGKQKAIYLPTSTMTNQLAIKFLN